MEALTDRLAAGAWQRLGDDATQRCARLLEPLAARAWSALPAENPIPVAARSGDLGGLTGNEGRAVPWISSGGHRFARRGGR